MPREILEYSMYINGAFVEAQSGERGSSLCPADQEVIATFPRGASADVALAVAAARDAFENTDWGHVRNSVERGRLLREVGRRIRDRLDELAEIESLDTGKTITETNLIDIHQAADTFEYFADLATQISGEVLPVPADALDLALREPLGVCGAIAAWNFPIMFAAWKIAPALAAGNTMVFKPAELSSMSSLELAKICDEVGLPPGVVNIVTGSGSKVGQALAEHDDVAKLSFTGSTEVGRKILQAAGSNLKKTTLELGGKSPNIVFPDAELERAVSGALTAIFYNAGECCIAGSRLLLHADLYDDFVEQLVERARKIKVGHPLDWESRMGPLITPTHRDQVLAHVNWAKQNGLKLLCGGEAPKDPELARGNYLLPTIFAADSNGLKLAQEEIFGPVLTILKFEEEDEAVRIANDTVYGLAGAVWTRDIKRAFRVAKRIKAGQVWINQYMLITPFAPHGGFKQSGYGKDLSKYSLEEYTQLKNIYVDLSEDEFLALYD
ncbi:MAG: aldehyde dehydrogenase family protein [bacterium]